MQAAWVRSLVGELGSRRPPSVQNILKIKIKRRRDGGKEMHRETYGESGRKIQVVKETEAETQAVHPPKSQEQGLQTSRLDLAENDSPRGLCPDRGVSGLKGPQAPGSCWPEDPGLGSVTVAPCLCAQGPVPSLLWASVSSSVKWVC